MMAPGPMDDEAKDEAKDEATAGPAAPAGLRERNRIQRQRVIRLAGLRLFAERGYDETSISDIAEAANVAPRTVSLYYPAKLDIALAEIDDVMSDLFPALASRPAGTSGVDVLEMWLEGVLGRLDHEAMTLTGEAFQRNPSLQALAAARMQPDLDRIIARITDQIAGPHRAFAAGMVVRAASAIVAHLLTTAPQGDPGMEITTVVRFLRGGIDAISVPPG